MKKYKLITKILFLMLILSQTNLYSMTQKQQWICGTAALLFVFNHFMYDFQEESRKREIETWENDIMICQNIKTEFEKIDDPDDSDEGKKNFENIMRKMIYVDHVKNICGGAFTLVKVILDLVDNNNNNKVAAYCEFKNDFLPKKINVYIRPILINHDDAKIIQKNTILTS